MRREQQSYYVLPLTRAWIEMVTYGTQAIVTMVLPLTREWIEIIEMPKVAMALRKFSLLRGSGLK